MPDAPDPFAHHPELAGLIVPPEQSKWRNLDLQSLSALLRQQGGRTDWLLTDEEREATRHEALRYQEGDLWIFAYGSLMWDPAFHFEEVRRAHVADHARRFILRDIYGGRGNAETPGLMAALDRGPGCHGLAFRIAADRVEEETAVIWRREKVGPGYVATTVTADLGDARVPALAFVADHAAEIIAGDITRADQVRFCATGKGFLGTSLQYLENIASHFAALGIEDTEVASLLADARAYPRG